MSTPARTLLPKRSTALSTEDDPPGGPLVLVVQPDGKGRALNLPTALPGQVKTLGDLVGGFYDTIGDGSWLALVNQQAKRLRLDSNLQADVIARTMGHQFGDGEILHGPVVFASRRGLNGFGDCPAEVLHLAHVAGVVRP
jgi:hypothetical protein